MPSVIYTEYLQGKSKKSNPYQNLNQVWILPELKKWSLHEVDFEFKAEHLFLVDRETQDFDQEFCYFFL